MKGVVYGAGSAVEAMVNERCRNDPASCWGAFYVGSLVDCIFLGILFHQAWRYYGSFPNDSKWIKRLVAAVVLGSILKTFQSCLGVWQKSIMAFGNWEKAAELTWPFYTLVGTSALLSTIAQSFFVWRCFVLTDRSWFLLILLVSTILGSLGLAVAVSVYSALDPLYLPRFRELGVPMITSACVADLLIASIVSYKLSTSMESGYSQDTDTLLKRWQEITWQAAIPPVFFQITYLAVFLTSPDNSWHLLCNTLIPRVYVFSLLYTLNSRIDVRNLASSVSGEYAPRAGGARDDPSSAIRKGPQQRLSLSTFHAVGRTTTIEQTFTVRGGPTVSGHSRDDRSARPSHSLTGHGSIGKQSTIPVPEPAANGGSMDSLPFSAETASANGSDIEQGLHGMHRLKRLGYLK